MSDTTSASLNSTRSSRDRRRGHPRPRTLNVDAIKDSRIVRLFREALARRGVTTQKIYKVDSPYPLACENCFTGSLEALGWEVELLQPLPDEYGVLESYDELSWYFDRVEERDELPIEDFADDEQRATEGREARFHADSHAGLYRIHIPATDTREAEALYLWVFDNEGLEVMVGARHRSVLRPLLTEVHRRDIEHDRKYTGLILIGNSGEGRNRRTPVKWEDIILPTDLRDEIRMTIEEFFAAGPLYKKHGMPHRRGILLAGPPGNGKTSLLKAIGSTLEIPVIVATLDGPSETHNTRNAFERAAKLAPSVLCFEDLDALVGEGPGLSQFLNLLDGLEPLEGVLVLATTNRPDRIDPAIAKRPSRFDRVFVIPEPDREQREAYLRILIAEDHSEAARLADLTEGYSMAFLKELVLQARLRAVRRNEEHVSRADLDAALASTGEHMQLASQGLDARGKVGF